MRIVVPVYFDYASSLCYVAWRIVAVLDAELDVAFDWRGVMIAAQYPAWKPGDRIREEIRVNIERVAHEADVTLRIPERWLDSRAALEGAVFAAQHGCAAAFHDGIFRAAYEHGEDIADKRVLIHIAAASGLPVGSFMEHIATRRAAPWLAATLEEARAHGISGYPTFLLGEFPLIGVQPYATMKQLIARHLEHSRQRLH